MHMENCNHFLKCQDCYEKKNNVQEKNTWKTKQPILLLTGL